MEGRTAQTELDVETVRFALTRTYWKESNPIFYNHYPCSNRKFRAFWLRLYREVSDAYLLHMIVGRRPADVEYSYDS